MVADPKTRLEEADPEPGDADSLETILGNAPAADSVDPGDKLYVMGGDGTLRSCTVSQVIDGSPLLNADDASGLDSSNDVFVLVGDTIKKTTIAGLGSVLGLAGGARSQRLSKFSAGDLAFTWADAYQKTAVVDGAAAGDVTVAAIGGTDDHLDAVIFYALTDGAVSGVSDLTAEFTITDAATINNADGTDTTGGRLEVRWTPAVPAPV
jgi:hypothetical protein